MFKQIAILATVAAFVTPAAFAKRQGSLTLTGKVPQECELNVVQTKAATEILNIAAGDEKRHVGNVFEKCNDPKGYFVEAYSQNTKNVTGKFKDSVSGDEQFYTITYNGKLVKDRKVTDSDKPAPKFIKKTVHITYPANDAISSSDGFTYTDKIFFTLTAK